MKKSIFILVILFAAISCQKIENVESSNLKDLSESEVSFVSYSELMKEKKPQ